MTGSGDLSVVDGPQRQRIKPLEVGVPIAVSLFITIVFLPNDPAFGLYLLALSALTIGPAFLLRMRGWSVPALFLITPALFFSLDSFMLRLGWYNTIEYNNHSWPVQLTPESLQIAALLALVGNAAFWVGFFLPVSRILADRALQKLGPWLRDDAFQPREWRVWLAFAIGMGCRLYLIKVGIGGYFSDPGARASAAPYIQFLLILENLTQIALVLYLCTLLLRRGFSWWRFGAMFGLEMGSVLLLGFKGEVVIRFLLLAMAYVLVRRRLPWQILLTGAAALIVIFPVNLAARAAFGSGQVQVGSFGSIQRGYAAGLSQILNAGSPATFVSQNAQQIMYNSGQLETFAMVVQYEKQTGNRLGGSEYLYPVLSVIPRALLPNKPPASYGGFVYNTVYGLPGQVSVGQTVPGDFDLNFGWPGIIVGLLLFGVLQRIAAALIRRTTSIRYLALVPIIAVQLAMPNSDFGAWSSGVLRLLVFGVGVLWLLAPRDRARPSVPADENARPFQDGAYHVASRAPTRRIPS